MGAPASTSQLRRMLEGQLSQLSNEVERLFEEARVRARGELAEQLNQAVRRIRHAGSHDDLAATLLDSAAALASGVATFRIEENTAKGENIRGVTREAAEAFRSLELPLEAAPALAGAMETHDPVVAASTAGEISAELAALASPADGRVFIFPLVVKQRVPMLLYCWGARQGPALEMLTQVAAAVWDSLAAPDTLKTPQLVSIAPATPPASAWDTLPAEEQAVHLRAQRFARVQVAEMRLREAPAVQSGRTQRDLYGTLRGRIDDARVTFRQSFFAPCSSMVDYLHLELVRTLAHDDAEMLGKDYPGPLV